MINKLEIDGYRLLDGFEADLGDLTVVIGANGSGKSTLLRCLELISEAAEYPINRVLLSHGGLIWILSATEDTDTLSCALTFSKSEETGPWGTLPVKTGVDLVYEFKLHRDAMGVAMPLYEALRSAKPLPGHTETFKFLESRGGKHTIYDISTRHLVEPTLFPEASDEEASALGSFPFHAEPPGDAPAGDAEQASLLLAQLRFLDKYPVPCRVRLLLAFFEFYPRFKIGPDAGARRPSGISPAPTLDPGGDNLAAVLHNIFTRHAFRESAQEVREFLRSAYPWVEQVTAEPSYAGPGNVAVRIQEAGMHRQMEMAEVSDGMLRFLCLEAALLNPFPPPLIAIDEPEVGLHPRLLPIVADIIKTASERTQVLVTTHSPELLGCFDLNQVAVMTREDGRAKWYRPASRESLRQMLEAVGGDTLADLHRSGELEAMP